jgi:hypothetical protein
MGDDNEDRRSVAEDKYRNMDMESQVCIIRIFTPSEELLKPG